MTTEKDIASEFALDGIVTDVNPHGRGLINDTFMVTTENGYRTILQRINRHVFPKPALIMENLRRLEDHITRRSVNKDSAQERRLPEILKTRQGRDYFLDTHGDFWRCWHFIENTITFETITHLSQAEDIGHILGNFHALVHDLDPALMHKTLPGFHDAAHYLERFTEASRSVQQAGDGNDLNRWLIFVEQRRSLIQQFDSAKRSGILAVRVIHGDTKLNNFLFDETSGRAVCLIDLDTVQPGLIHYDVGDCLRSCANTSGESPEDIDTVRFDLDICRSILKAYLHKTGSFLSDYDFRFFYSAIRLIPFELGLRFLTDHLEGDHYFKIEWPGQNLHRAQVQFRLTELIESMEREIKSIINDYRISR